MNKEEIEELKREIRFLKQANIEYKERIDKAIELIENTYYSKNTTDIDKIGFTTNKLLQVRTILRGESNE